jgi:hypothetical protein
LINGEIRIDRTPRIHIELLTEKKP